MTVRTSPSIVFVPGADFIREDFGVKWGIKVTDTSDVDLLSLFVWDGANWALGAQLSSFNWEEDMKKRGSIREWLRVDVIPAINRWLATTFKARDGQPATFATLAEELDSIIVRELRVTVAANGTITASLP